MKQTQKQNVIININNEVKSKRKRRYKRKNIVIEQTNPQTTTYNPNTLVKNNITPSYGLKSINPVISSDTSMLSTLLLDKLKQPEPPREQYITQMTPIKQEQITPIKQEPLTPNRQNNINQFTINPMLEQQKNIQQTFTPKQEPAKPTFSIYQSPAKTNEDSFLTSPITSLFRHNYLGPGRHPLNAYEYKSQITSRINYLKGLIKKDNISQEIKDNHQKEIDELIARLRKGDFKEQGQTEL